LCDIGLTLRSKNIQYNYDTIVYRNTAAIVIQRAYRGLTVRSAYSKKFIRNLISRRAIIAIQRWWRQMNTLIRRFKFHNHISQCCRSLRYQIKIVIILVANINIIVRTLSIWMLGHSLRL